MKLIGFKGSTRRCSSTSSSEAGESRDLAGGEARRGRLARAALSRLGGEDGRAVVGFGWVELWIALDELMAGKPMKPIKGPPPHPGAVEIP